MKNIRQIIFCTALVLLAAASAFSQTTGALLTINGTVTDGVNTVPVSLSISDKDIHSGTFVTVPVNNGSNGSNCTAADQIPTDAYVMQAAAPTGCDPGNAFEGSIPQGFATLYSPEGSLISYAFQINTFYFIGGGEFTQCNTSGTICSANSSFLTVTPYTADPWSFTGTITLAASSRFCGTSGVVVDSDTGTLASDEEASVTLALAQDASSCG